MFGLFKKASEKDKLQKKYRQLMEEAHRYSTIDRKKSDEMVYQANEVLKSIDALGSRE